MFSGISDQAFVMKITGMKRQTDSFELKKGLCPVNGMNSYQVFKNGMLVFMMDGDRSSVFRPEAVETISIAGYPDLMVYKVGKWVFTGGAVVTDGLLRKLPKGYLVCPAVDKKH